MNLKKRAPQFQASSHCETLNLRGLAVKESSVRLPRVRATLWGVALSCVSNAPGRGGEGSVFDPSIQLDLLSFLG